MKRNIKITYELGLNSIQALRYKFSKKYKQKVDKFVEKAKRNERKKKEREKKKKKKK